MDQGLKGAGHGDNRVTRI